MNFPKVFKMVFGGIVTTLSVSVAALYLYQNKLVYPSWAGKAKEYVEKPTSVSYPGLNFKEFYLKTPDNIRLQCYDFPNPESKTTIIILRPNAGNIGHSLAKINYLYHEYNASVFIFSYRGYGYSEGTPSEQGIKTDVECIMDHIEQDEFHKQRKKVLLGTSIGGAVAIHIAYRYHHMVEGVILENTFLSVRKVIPYLIPFMQRFTSMCHEVWDSEAIISKVGPKTPFLFLNSERDEIVPSNHSLELYKLCNSSEKVLKRFPLGKHNDIVIQDGYWEAFDEFMYRYNLM